MSASFVRKGLDLFREDLVNIPGSDVPKKKASKTATVSITNKTVLKKLKTNRNKNDNPRRDQLTVKGKKVKPSVQQYTQRKAKDNTGEAIKFLSLLSSKKTGTKVVEQVTEYQQRKVAKKPEDRSKPKEPKSCFSEADFARFEREYFVGPRRRPAVQ